MKDSLLTFIFSTLGLLFILMMLSPLYVLANANVAPNYTHALIGLLGIVGFYLELMLLDWLETRA